jgi:murein L,D-transpeptidase YcbB/YkuD
MNVILMSTLLFCFWAVISVLGYNISNQQANDNPQKLILNNILKNFISFDEGGIYPFYKVDQYIDSCFHNTKFYLTKTSSINLVELEPIYKQNEYQAIFNKRELIIEAISLIKLAEYHGLNQRDYGIEKIDGLFTIWESDNGNSKLAAELDLMLMMGIKKFSAHLLYGKLNPQYFHDSWNFPHRTIENIDSVLLAKIKEGKVFELEHIFQPKQVAYTMLKHEYRNFLKKEDVKSREIKYPEKRLRKGDLNTYVLELKQELFKKGFFHDSMSMVFNTALEKAIKTFQLKHGLTPDGIPGKETYKVLNWTEKRYLIALKTNLERLRWLPDSIDTKGILVNIPSAKLQLYTDTTLLFETKLIVGKTKNKTPIFQSEINYLVFNPCWTVPNSIATEKMLPKLKTDSNFLKHRNMFIGLNGVEQSSNDIDFNQYNEDNFPYKIYQRTGSGNALGKVKFMFPNSYSIYLHDTPNKYLFKKDYRAYSHGCVRVQNAMELANILLYTINNHKSSISYYLKKGYPEKVYLNHKIPLSIVYLTCWGDLKSSEVIFYNDIYFYDLTLLNALEAN